MTQVDPFLLPIPRVFLKDPEVRFFFEHFSKIIHDLTVRTGGGNDDIADQSIKELYPWQALTDEEPESVFGIYGSVSRGEPESVTGIYGSVPRGTEHSQLPQTYGFGTRPGDVEIISTSVDYTTTGDQIIVCTNTTSITITLNPNPDDAEEVHIKRQNNGLVIISGAIDGQTSITPILRYDSPHLIYTVEAGEWSII